MTDWILLAIFALLLIGAENVRRYLKIKYRVTRKFALRRIPVYSLSLRTSASRVYVIGLGVPKRATALIRTIGTFIFQGWL